MKTVTGTARLVVKRGRFKAAGARLGLGDRLSLAFGGVIETLAEVARLTNEPDLKRLATMGRKRMASPAVQRELLIQLATLDEEMVSEAIAMLTPFKLAVEKLKTAEALKPPWKRTKKARSA